MAGLDYTQTFNEILTLSLLSNDTNFTTNFPSAINYAEQRMYRELDLLDTTVRDSSSALVAANRNFTLPTSLGTFVVVEEINIVSPAGSAPDSGARYPLIPVSKSFLDFAWGSVTGTAIPKYFAMLTQGSILVGPWPDAAYTVEVVGTQRPAPISTTNATTFLSVYLPDMWIAALMIFICGYKGNFGAQADDPKSAQSWESQYQSLMSSAKKEEVRKRFMGDIYSSQEPSPIAQPPRN